jgi:hypothetical protein
MDYLQIPISKQALGRLKILAEQSDRSIEEIAANWVERAAEPPVETLSNEEVLELADMHMSEEDQEEFSELLARNREGLLSEQDRIRFDEVMTAYRHNMLRKSQALKVAIERKLRPRLDAE